MKQFRHEKCKHLFKGNVKLTFFGNAYILICPVCNQPKWYGSPLIRDRELKKLKALNEKSST